MSDELLAQRRGKQNDTIHLFESERSSSLCEGRGRTSAAVKHKTRKETYTMSVEEAVTEHYLIRDGTVIGEMCGRCQQVIRMANRFDTKGIEDGE